MRRAQSSWQLSKEVLVRVGADVFMLQMAFLAALALRFFDGVAFDRLPQGDADRWLWWDSLAMYQSGAWPLTLLCILAFTCSGFYTYGRAYRGRYKALVLVQAVSLGHMVFGLICWGLPGFFNVSGQVVLLAWLLSVGLLLASRLWAQLWAKVVLAERPMARKDESQSVQHILVIGGAGYIGSALLPKLLDAGYRVRLLDLLLYSTEPIRDVLNRPNLEIVQADFRQIDKVVEAMRDVDAVVHLGAIVGDPACALDEELTLEINLMATRMIAEVAKGCGVERLIFASTCSVYGASDEVLDERSALKPVSLYARSKIASEQVLKRMAGPYFAPVFLRFGTIYGLSGRTRFDLVINLLTAKAVVDGEITVFGGQQWRPFLHVDDAALSILKALKAPLAQVRNQVFNVGSDAQNYTIDEIGEMIQKLVPTAKLVHRGSDADRRNYRVNFSKIRQGLHFAPQWSVEQGIQQVIDALHSGEIADYHAVKYSNVEFLRTEGTARLVRNQPGWVYELINDVSPPRPSEDAWRTAS